MTEFKSEKAIGTPKRGSIVLLALGTISLLVVLVFSLSSRMSKHTNTITLIDQNAIARNFLESYANDVLFQLNRQMRARQGQFFDLMENWISTGKAVPDQAFSGSELGYSPGPSLTEIGQKYSGIKKYSLTFDENPKISISGWEPAATPSLFNVAAGSVWPERKASISIECEASFAEKNYRLTLKKEFFLVLRVLPVLKDFAFFFDRIDEEHQIRGDGSIVDGINIIPMEYGELADKNRFPLVLNSFHGIAGKAKLVEDPDYSGRVYLGRADKPFVLNLAGELSLRRGQGRFSDLWLIRKDHFERNYNMANSGPAALTFKNMGLLQDPERPESLTLSFRGTQFNEIDPATNKPDPFVFASIYCLGFGKEIISNYNNGIFAKSDWSMNSFIGQDPGYAKLQNDSNNLAMASAIKPYGFNMDYYMIGLSASDKSLATQGFDKILNMATTMIPMREIYGAVTRRYFILSYFHIGSQDGPLRYMNAASYAPFFLIKPGIVDQKYYFNPPGPGGKDQYGNYQPFMSRVVSGDISQIATHRGDDTNFPDNFEGYELNPEQNGVPRENPRQAKDFSSPEGIRMAAGKNFDNCKDFILNLRKNQTANENRASLETLFGRIHKSYATGQDFLNDVLKDGDEGGSAFDLGGVYYVDSDLDLSQGISEDRISGGIVIVNGSLKLGSVDRGLPKENLKEMVDTIVAMNQDDALTFVVLPGDEHKIHLTGESYLGIHLVHLARSGPTPIEVDKPFIFFGSLAISRPNLQSLTQKLANSNSETSFYYLPAFGDSRPSLSFMILEDSRRYNFEVFQ